jgi:hypothetical protein
MSGRDPIKVAEDMYAPPFARYVASYGDWDLGDPIGTGATREAAIADLIEDAGDDE